MHGAITIKDIWVPLSPYSQDSTIMDRVLEIDIDPGTAKCINLCRLHKQMYHVSDLLHSQQRHLHADIFNPHKQRQNLEKFPVISVPKSYWKVWERVVKTIYQSTNLSSQISGPKIRKEHCIWLQHDDHSHIIRNCGNHEYVKYNLLQHTRNIQTYTRAG